MAGVLLAHPTVHGEEPIRNVPTPSTTDTESPAEKAPAASPVSSTPGATAKDVPSAPPASGSNAVAGLRINGHPVATVEQLRAELAAVTPEGLTIEVLRGEKVVERVLLKSAPPAAETYQEVDVWQRDGVYRLHVRVNDGRNTPWSLQFHGTREEMQQKIDSLPPNLRAEAQKEFDALGTRRPRLSPWMHRWSHDFDFPTGPAYGLRDATPPRSESQQWSRSWSWSR